MWSLPTKYFVQQFHRFSLVTSRQSVMTSFLIVAIKNRLEAVAISKGCKGRHITFFSNLDTMEINKTSLTRRALGSIFLWKAQNMTGWSMPAVIQHM